MTRFTNRSISDEVAYLDNLWQSCYQNCAERLFPGVPILSIAQDDEVRTEANAEYSALIDAR